MKLNDFGSLCNAAKPAKDVDVPNIETIVAGKNTYVYDAHTYHTKVPPEGIELLIRHFTDKGDVVLDPFCGSGMTGIAAQRQERKALLCDLSPAATFIASNMNTPVDAEEYMRAVQMLLKRANWLNKNLYTTTCRECGKPAKILYTVWSYGLLCSECGQEFVLWDVARDERETVKESKILTEFNCPHCGKRVKKRALKRTRLYPVALGYKCCTKSLKERICSLTDADRELLNGITYQSIPSELWYPKNSFPAGVNTAQPILHGIDTVDKAYFPRALWAYAFLWNEAKKWENPAIRDKLIFTLTSLYQRITKFSEFRFWGGSGNIANYNVPQIINEQNVFSAFERKAKTIYLYFANENIVSEKSVQISTQSACHLSQLQDNSVDYVFTDPPFGANINYSEMNFLWESWLEEFTDNTEEAIVNRIQHKSNDDYGDLMCKAISEIHRVLKPGAWATIMFHNSSDKIWSQLQRAIYRAGFEIDGTMIFDKRHGTFKQFVSENAVGLDLLIHCRKKDAIQKRRMHHEPEDISRQISQFAETQIKKNHLATYITHFDHVNRPNEFNYRKLYSEWIAEFVGVETIASDFEHFREIVKPVIENVGVNHMEPQKILPAFTDEEVIRVHRLLSTRVAFMMGRKFEEGDWADVYCKARNIENKGWSNLNIDITTKNQGIEHKMLCVRQSNILSECGRTLMHPSATRSIRLPSLDSDPNDAMVDILTQYADFLESRRKKVLEESPQYDEADMRTGWLLWSENLHEFLYFEEKTQIPNPDDYTAAWVENKPKGARKPSKNLWIYEKSTGKKRYSVTTTAGAKIQPYFDVPPIGTPGLYHFVVIGERLLDDSVRMWVTEQTYRNLCTLVNNDLSKENISKIILEVADNLKDSSLAKAYDYEKACELIISSEAYDAIQRVLPGVNDDHSIQLLIGYLSQQ